MSVEIGTEAAQFPEKEFINEIFVAVCVAMHDFSIDGWLRTFTF